LRPDDCATLRLAAEQLSERPVISVLMPAYNPKPEWLAEAIESVMAQAYPYWELCIADDASPDLNVRAVLERYAQADRRIRVAFRPTNGHISAASNTALELATGQWVALLDHDDLLPPHALFCVAQAINDRPDVRLIYSDEDKITPDGERFGAYFKGDWNPDLFRSQNLFSHLGVFRTDLVRSLGGFRLGLEGSQDYDLALRAVEKVRHDQICHIPRVLYHWRTHPQSTSSSMDAKPYAVVAAERALNEHLQRCGVRAQAQAVEFSSYRVRYELPTRAPLASVILRGSGGPGALKRCVTSIVERTRYPNYEVLVLADQCKLVDVEACVAAGGGRVRVLEMAATGGVLAPDQLLHSAHGDVITLLDADVEVISEQWLEEMVSLAVRPEVGAVGARLWYPDGTLRHAGFILGIGGVAAHSHHRAPRGFPGHGGRAVTLQSVSAVSAECLAVRREIGEKVRAAVDPRTGHFADIDFCLRLREAGYANVWTPHAELCYHGPMPQGSPRSAVAVVDSPEARVMAQRWGKLLASDPYYTPNLTLEFADFSLAWPPRLRALPVTQPAGAP
jgi:GT2 family glycosyltransferase